jgi:hypothetical protein
VRILRKEANVRIIFEAKQEWEKPTKISVERYIVAGCLRTINFGISELLQKQLLLDNSAATKTCITSGGLLESVFSLTCNKTKYNEPGSLQRKLATMFRENL